MEYYQSGIGYRCYVLGIQTLGELSNRLSLKAFSGSVFNDPTMEKVCSLPGRGEHRAPEGSGESDSDEEKLDDEIVKASMESGFDLRDYSAKLNGEISSAHSRAVKQCIEQAEKYVLTCIKTIISYLFTECPNSTSK